MTILLYLPEGSTLLAERWLAGQPADQSVFLLHEPAAADAAHQLAEKYPIIHGRSGLRPDSGTETRVTTEKAVLPVATDSYPLIFQQPASMPDIRPYYPIIRRLHALGVRNFEFANLAGSFEISVPHVLDEFIGRHNGRRAFVIGNGPSLNQIDMTLLKDEITFGSNRCYLGYERWGFEFTYWGMIDWLQIEEYGPEYEKAIPANTLKFVPFKYLPLLHFENVCPLNTVYTPRPIFSDTPDEIYRGHSVTYALIEVAMLMGCDPIILIGVDHRYNLNENLSQRLRRGIRQTLIRPIYETPFYQGIRAWRAARKKNGASKPALWNASDAGEPTHFNDKYTAGKTKQFMMPYPHECERDYRCARKWAEAHGRQILNATPNSALDIFDKIEYGSLFKK